MIISCFQSDFTLLFDNNNTITVYHLDSKFTCNLNLNKLYSEFKHSLSQEDWWRECLRSMSKGNCKFSGLDTSPNLTCFYSPIEGLQVDLFTTSLVKSVTKNKNDLIELIVTNFQQSSQSLKSLQREHDLLKKSHGELTLKYEELSDKQIEKSDEMLNKFIALLNEKKKQIRSMNA